MMCSNWLSYLVSCDPYTEASVSAQEVEAE